MAERRSERSRRTSAKAPVLAKGVRGLPDAKVRATVEGMAPKLDLFIHASTSVNAARAEQCASLSKQVDDTGPWRLERHPERHVVPLEPADVRARKAGSVSNPAAPKVNFSLFVQLDADLPPEVRAKVARQVGELAQRARWKADTAALEVSGERLRELHQIPGVRYVEPGQTLRAPDPVVGHPTKEPARDLRAVKAARRAHRDGRGVLVGIIDVGGFDFAHSDFRDGPHSTRWEAIWDQAGSIRPSPADRRDGEGFQDLAYGSEIHKVDMDRALSAAQQRGMRATSLEPQSVMVAGSHGTHVASIAAGNLGVARKARLAGVLVALEPEDTEARSSFYDSTRIADAVDYLLALAAELGGGEDTPMPVSINISLGTNGHAHDTSSAMARWIDNALSAPGRCVSVAAGNAGQVEPEADGDHAFVMGRIHAGGRIGATDLRHELAWRVGGDQIVDISENEMEIWYSPQDRFDVEVQPPGGPWIGPIKPGQHIRSEALDNGTILSVYSETYFPANGANRISVVLSPFFGQERDGVVEVGPIANGVWRVRITGKVVRDGRYDAWIERDDPRRIGDPSGSIWRFPSFFEPGTYTADRMISSLACAERLLAVANVDVTGNRAHVTSSRGPTRDGREKPDIGADGTSVVAASGFDRERTWIEMTGTSMASPYVCGVAALMLAIVPRLTSAQILGIMRTTSSPLPGHDFAWRNDTGFGMVNAEECVNETLAHRQSRQPAGAVRGSNR